MIETNKIIAYRGDSITIPIEAELKESAVYRAQLRRKPDSQSYFTILIDNNNLVISTEQSYNLGKGAWYAELEENDGGITSTVQRTLLLIKYDVTKTYGDPAPVWETNQSVEVAEVIAKNIYFRMGNGQLLSLGTNDVYYRHTQNLPSDIWEINHNLNKKPSVMITDSAGTVVEGRINYIDDNNLTVVFNASFSGYAELN